MSNQSTTHSHQRTTDVATSHILLGQSVVILGTNFSYILREVSERPHLQENDVCQVKYDDHDFD